MPESKQLGMTAGQAKSSGKKRVRVPGAGLDRKQARERLREEKAAFKAQNEAKILSLAAQGIRPSVHIVTKSDGRVLHLIRLNPETGIATCRTTRNTVGVKLDDIERLARPEEIPRLSKGVFCFS